MTARDWLDIAGGVTILFGMLVVYMQACEIDQLRKWIDNERVSK